jgi:hypothetical protein
LFEFVPTEPWHLDYMGAGRPNVCEDTRGITAIRDGKPEAVCIMDNWAENSCQMHIWIGNPMVLRHGYQEEVFGFIFGSGRKKVIGVTPSDNKKSLKFNHRMGFREICRIKDGCSDGVDFVIQEMTREEWYGKEKRTGT